MPGWWRSSPRREAESSAASRTSAPLEPSHGVLIALPLLSGAAALVFEVLWLKDLGIIFGNTASASAAVVSLFFLGLALGSAFWGRRLARIARPLRLYGLLELGVAGSAVAFLGLLSVYRALYDSIFDRLPAELSLVAKMVLAAVVLLPPAFCMGGTLPALVAHVHPSRAAPGRSASFLYALNTLGATIGALAAGFYLPALLGFRGSYQAALAVSTGVGLAALLLDARRPRLAVQATAPMANGARAPHDRPLHLAIAFLSGFLTLGLQTLWTRLLAQVLNNSVYAFAAILVTFLLALACGAAAARVAMKTGGDVEPRLAAVLALAGAASVAASLVFVRLTHGLTPLALGSSWPQYVASIFLASAVLVFIPVMLTGMVLPLLFFAKEQDPSPGGTLGRLLAVNSAGSILGAIAAGFIFIQAFGYWNTVWLFAATYVVLGAAMLWHARHGVALRVASMAAPVVFAVVIVTAKPPTVALAFNERLVDLREGSGGTVAIVQSGDNLVMRLNNTYVLGDTRSHAVETLQAHLPLLLHAAPRDVFFLGLGTGITAGAALDHPVQRVVAAELLPEVIAAARSHYAAFANGLFEDNRVRLVAEDGRTLLAAQRATYDVIIADLFTPWHAGTGSLYTREHFRTIRARLRPAGMFVQWLPFFQMSRDEVLVIARTMQAVFPQVTLWRGNFSADQPIAALIARAELRPLEQALLRRSAARMPSRSFDGGTQDHMVGLFYAGNLNALRGELARVPVNTDDRPVIEYLAPRQQVGAGRRFVGEDLATFLQQLLDSLPPDADPVLADLPARERRYVRTGLDFFRYHLSAWRRQPDSVAFYLGRVRAVLGGVTTPPPD